LQWISDGNQRKHGKQEQRSVRSKAGVQVNASGMVRAYTVTSSAAIEIR
jgi:hypothetical protein